MGKGAQILAKLADGQFHSGQELANHMGLSRSGVWKLIQNLQSKGVEVFAVQGKGYRLSQPIELLSKEHIQCEVATRITDFSGDIAVLWETESTNQYLSQRNTRDAISGATCLAEWQSAGRGRRGRTWISPLGGNICLSQLWRFTSGPAQLSGLSLAAAIAVVRVIHQCGATGAGLKWPNDILIEGQKLAGILLEINGESNGPSNVIVGIGINVRLPESSLQEIDQPVTSLEAVLGRTIDRNQFAARLICELLEVSQKFSEHGFAAFLEKWLDLDVYLNQKINLSLPSGNISGINRGVDHSGALQVERGGQVYSYQSGEVSLRAIAN